MEAFGDTPPYSVFSDSLEVYGSDWTGDLLQQFAGAVLRFDAVFARSCSGHWREDC